MSPCMFHSIFSVSGIRIWTSLGNHASAFNVIYSASDAVLISPSNWCSALACPRTELGTQGRLSHTGGDSWFEWPNHGKDWSSIISVTECTEKTHLLPLLWNFLKLLWHFLVSFFPKVRFSNICPNSVFAHLFPNISFICLSHLSLVSVAGHPQVLGDSGS